MSYLSKVLVSSIGAAVIMALGIVYGIGHIVPNAQAQRASYAGTQPNPNPARILNRTDMNTRDGRKELLTVETIPGVVCVIVSGAMAPGTSTSCVSYRP